MMFAVTRRAFIKLTAMTATMLGFRFEIRDAESGNPWAFPLVFSAHFPEKPKWCILIPHWVKNG